MLRRAFLFLPLAPAVALAHSAKHGDIKIGHAWALPSPSGQDGQCFMPLLNTGKISDALVAARTSVCQAVQLRRNPDNTEAADTQFNLDPNKPLAMRPQALHLRLLGLREDLKLGQRFPLTLRFQQAGEIDIEVYVEHSPGE
jgi:periplasmic copper chaperone A